MKKIALKVQHNLSFCTFSAALKYGDYSQGDALGYRMNGLSALNFTCESGETARFLFICKMN
ncbi:MAG: hypothetical protein IJY59_00180 [Bacteroidaceae bacterium]|nr:hypothetical protein [Bacteroidaceae bacterium]